MATIDIKKMHLYNNQVKMNSNTLLSTAGAAKIQTKHKPKVSLLIGGYKSGKSSYALDYILGFEFNSEQRVIIATSQSRIDEVTLKSKSINSSNSDHFTIIEDSSNIEKTLKTLPPSSQIVVVDNICVWLSSLIENGDDIKTKEKELLDILSNPKQDIVIISNMIGMAGESSDEKVNQLRDLSGSINQKLAAVCDNVILLVAGIPLKIKGELL